MMHDSRTYGQFRELGRKCLDMWIGDGEVAYVSWLTKFTASRHGVHGLLVLPEMFLGFCQTRTR